MLHYYFHTKEQLFDKVLAEKIEIFRDSVASVFEHSDLPVVEQIKEAMSRHYDFVRQNPLLPRFIINEMSVRPEYVEKIKQTIAPIFGNVIRKLQSTIDDAAQRGEICPMQAITLMLDIVSLNLFAFIAHPIVQHIVPEEEMEEFYEARKKENIEVIMRRLKGER